MPIMNLPQPVEPMLPLRVSVNVMSVASFVTSIPRISSVPLPLFTLGEVSPAGSEYGEVVPWMAKDEETANAAVTSEERRIFFMSECLIIYLILAGQTIFVTFL